MTARAVMVCGTTSGAGKSFLVTALARWYANQGLKVAPFKAQNMSNNARVVAGGEIGSAQYFQALAARATPDVHMNPVLLTPESDLRSQVIVRGQRCDAIGAIPWRERGSLLWPIVLESLEILRETHDLLVIEGAGSPAEINLSPSDIVNMRIARAAKAATLIISDIDRGGAFAHLYGTYQLLAEEDRPYVRGFVLNKFRGDASLLAPAPERLEALTGVPTLGVLPLWRNHGLPEEDRVHDEVPAGAGLKIAIIAYPSMSNHDEFAPLRRAPCSVVWARRPEAIAAAELLILPGSKHVASDLGWLRQVGLDRAIEAHVRAGKPTLAVCGGLQMLGTEIRDPHAVEGAARGLALLPLATELQVEKRYAHGDYVMDPLVGFWAPLAGLRIEGYEIHHGRSSIAGAGVLREVIHPELGWQMENVLAVYLHGLFENAAVVQALFGKDCPVMDQVFDGLSRFTEEHLGSAALRALADL